MHNYWGNRTVTRLCEPLWSILPEPSPESVYLGGLYVCAGRLDIENLLKSPLSCSISYYNLGAWGFVCSGEAHQSNGDFKGGLGGPWPSQIFGWLPTCPLSLCLISRSSSFDWQIQQFGDFPVKVLTIFTSLLGLIGFLIASQSSWQRKITMQERHLCWPPYFLPWPGSGPPSFFILESPLHQSIPVAKGLNPPELPISDKAWNDLHIASTGVKLH